MRQSWSVFLLLASGVLQAASFDCAKATTPHEKAVCESPLLSGADDRMAAAYKAALAAAPPEMKGAVRDDQIAWIRWIEVSSAARASAPSTERASWLSESYASRTKELQHLVWRTGGVAFIWRSITEIAPEEPGGNTGSYDTESTPGYGTLHASWPQSVSNTAEWKAWNAAIELAAQNIESAANQREASADLSEPEDQWTQGWAANEDVEADVLASVDIVGQQLVASTIREDSMGHRAAHPNTTTIELNWLLKEKRELRSVDIFRAGTGWDQALQARCDKALRRQLGASYESDSDGDFAKRLHAVVVDPRNWQLDSRGLTVVFQRYSVSAYAAPADPVTVPWAVLSPFMQTSFVTPK